MKIGIVGLPNVGKSTLFNALTKSYSADAANFPFCTIEPNIGIVDVKDERLDKLSEISGSKKIIYANTKFVDIAGIVRGASNGEGLGNKFLAHIREVDAIVQVVRYFKDGEVVHVDGTVNPVRDVETINTELILADLEFVSAKLTPIERKAKMVKDVDVHVEYGLLKKLHDALAIGKLAHSVVVEENEQKFMTTYNLLTDKPFVYAINVTENDLADHKKLSDEFSQLLSAPVAIVCAKFESEMIGLDDDEKQAFIEDMVGKTDNPPTLDGLIKCAFDTVGLMYYFTTGEKESRAWTIKKNSTAPKAAAAIHTDFERGFIKAEVVSYEQFITAGGWSKAREKGFLRLEGKEYIVHDGDVITFRFNV